MNLFTLISVLVLITLFSVNVIAARNPFIPPNTQEIIKNNVTSTLSKAEEKSDMHYLSYPLQYAEAELLAFNFHKIIRHYYQKRKNFCR